MRKVAPFKDFLRALRAAIATFPDPRKGNNKHYTRQEAALGAFAVFFTQSPSVLAYQRDMAKRQGQSNAQPLFGLTEIPGDNQIRTLLDAVSPALLEPVFAHGLTTLVETQKLATFRSWRKRRLVVLDGTQDFSSPTISCPQCSHQPHRNGTTTYSHRMLTPVLVAPHQNKVIPLPPEFIVPHDGHDKQDCENAAAKRWRSSLYTFRWSVLALGRAILYCSDEQREERADEHLGSCRDGRESDGRCATREAVGRPARAVKCAAGQQYSQGLPRLGGDGRRVSLFG